MHGALIIHLISFDIILVLFYENDGRHTYSNINNYQALTLIMLCVKKVTLNLQVTDYVLMYTYLITIIQ